MYTGTIVRVVVSHGFGFIECPNSPDVFFHCKELSDDLAFDETLQERRVRFDIIDSAKGPRAANVQPMN